MADCAPSPRLLASVDDVRTLKAPPLALLPTLLDEMRTLAAEVAVDPLTPDRLADLRELQERFGAKLVEQERPRHRAQASR